MGFNLPGGPVTYANCASCCSIPWGGPSGYSDSSLNDSRSSNSSDPEGLMVAGQRAYMREERLQRQRDHDIEMASLFEGEGERADFIQLAMQDELQQAVEQHDQDLYYETLAFEEEEEQAQELFMLEVYPELMRAEGTRLLPSDISSGASSSTARLPSDFPKERL